MPTTSSARITIRGPRSVLDLKRPPTSPGEMLLREFLKPAGLTQVEAARRVKVFWQAAPELPEARSFRVRASGR